LLFLFKLSGDIRQLHSFPTRRSSDLLQLLATYDVLPNGQSMDLIDGGSYVSKTWFKIAHPEALKEVLITMGWLPDVMGANRENQDRKSTRLNSSHGSISYAVFCLKKK